MNADRTTKESPQEGILGRMDSMLQQAASLQKQDPEQALALAFAVLQLAGAQGYFYLASAKKVQGNVHFLRNELPQAIDFYQLALCDADKAGDTKLSGDIYYNLGRVYTSLKDYQAALQYLDKSLALRIKQADKAAELSSLNHIGQVYWELQNYPAAVDYFQKAAAYCDASINARQTATIYNNLGNALLKIDEIPRAMEAYIHSLKLKESFGNAADLATANLNLGNLYYTTADYPIALAYYLEAGKLYHKAGDPAKAAIVESNLGATYSALKEMDEATLHLHKALEYFEANKMSENHARTLNSIANIYLHKAEYPLAVKTYLQCLGLKTNLFNPESLAITYNNLSECYYCQCDYKAALDNTQKSMQYSSKIGSKTMLLKNYSQLAKIFAALKDFRNAYEALNSYKLIDMELYQAEKKTVLAEMMAHYDAEGKAREIELLKSGQHTLEEHFSQQVKDKLRYLKLYRSKLEEVKKRVAVQKKLKQLNAELETKIDRAVQDYKAQEQIIMQKSKLESLGNLAAGIAHEINQPLSAISMALDNIVNKTRLNKATPEYLENKCQHMQEDIERIRQIIEHVRLFSRDQKDSALEQVDVNATIQAAIRIIQPVYLKQHVFIEADLCSPDVRIIGNRYKLEQVMMNLLSNARDAILEKSSQNPEAEHSCTICLETSINGENVLISVADSGTGIDPDYVNMIFDPFYTTKNPDKGTGLGLSISYGIIHDMGGSISVTNNSGEGTTLTISLPVLRS